MKETKAEKKRAKFAREYHSEERVEWVSKQPCCACGYDGPVPRDNSHVASGGMGRKADYDKIVPHCVNRPLDGGVEIGCHSAYHALGRDRLRAIFNVSSTWAELAAETEARWLEYLERI